MDVQVRPVAPKKAKPRAGLIDARTHTRTHARIHARAHAYTHARTRFHSLDWLEPDSGALDGARLPIAALPVGMGLGSWHGCPMLVVSVFTSMVMDFKAAGRLLHRSLLLDRSLHIRGDFWGL